MTILIPIGTFFLGMVFGFFLAGAARVSGQADERAPQDFLRQFQGDEAARMAVEGDNVDPDNGRAW